MNNLLEGLRLVMQADVLLTILFASIYGLVVGALPGLSATMATALLVPVTFYMSPIAAVSAIIAASAMAIFSGDIPGCLLRIPGTPASAAYTDEAFAMTMKKPSARWFMVRPRVLPQAHGNFSRPTGRGTRNSL